MLITNATVITWGGENRILEGYSVLVRDGLIAELGSSAVLEAKYPGEERLDAGEKLLMPGNI